MHGRQENALEFLHKLCGFLAQLLLSHLCLLLTPEPHVDIYVFLYAVQDLVFVLLPLRIAIDKLVAFVFELAHHTLELFLLDVISVAVLDEEVIVNLNQRKQLDHGLNLRDLLLVPGNGFVVFNVEQQIIEAF